MKKKTKYHGGRHAKYAEFAFLYSTTCTRSGSQDLVKASYRAMKVNFFGPVHSKNKLIKDKKRKEKKI